MIPDPFVSLKVFKKRIQLPADLVQVKRFFAIQLQVRIITPSELQITPPDVPDIPFRLNSPSFVPDFSQQEGLPRNINEDLYIKVVVQIRIAEGKDPFRDLNVTMILP